MAKKVQPAKQKDRVSTEAKLIEAAEQVFSQAGYEGATTRMIAQAADINISLINRYFDGKYGLFIAVVTKKSEEFNTQELTYPIQETVVDELLHYGQFLLNRYFEGINLIRVCIGQFLSDPKFLKKFRDIISNRPSHPEIMSRLNELGSKKYKKMDPLKILDDMEIYAFGILITKFIIEGESEKSVQNTFKEFITTYSKHLESQLIELTFSLDGVSRMIGIQDNQLLK